MLKKTVNLAYFDIRICVALLSVCCRFVIGLSLGLSVCCRLRFQHSADDRFSVGVMSVIYRAIPYHILPEMPPTWTWLVLRCLQQHCRWPTAARSNENFAVFVGFVSVWPVWLGYHCGCRWPGTWWTVLGHQQARWWLQCYALFPKSFLAY